MYTRREIDEARRDLAADPNWKRPVHAVVDEKAPYIGKGPLYVWMYDHWLDMNQWIATHPLDLDPAPPSEPPPPAPVKKTKKRRKTKDERQASLFAANPHRAD